MKTQLEFKRYFRNNPKQVVYLFINRFGVKTWWVNDIRYVQKEHYLKALKRIKKQ